MFLDYAYHNPHDITESLKRLDKCQNILMYPFLKHCVREHILRIWKDTQLKEYDLYDWFEDNFYKIFSNKFKTIPRNKINEPHNQADAWIKYKDILIPVEIKLHDFNTKALLQLKRYMDFYKCKYGVAIANEQNCTLPKNILFINYNRNLNNNTLIDNLEVFNHE